MFGKKFHITKHTTLLLAIILGATLLRLILIFYNWPVTHSDESMMDLMALHIAYRGEHPIFYYGQNYMAPIEAYIGAALFRIFGVSLFAVRLGLLPFFTLFLFCIYGLTRMLYTRNLALATVVLLSLGSSDILTHQLLAIGGYPELLFFAAFIFLLATWLVLSPLTPTSIISTQRQWLRYAVYALLGLTIGLALWDDQLILPFVLTAGLLVLLFCWRDILSWAAPCFLIGLLLGGLPLILYNMHAKAGENSLDVLIYLHNVGAQEVLAAHVTRLQRLIGVLLFSIPIVTGFNPCQRIMDLPLFASSDGSTIACTVVQGLWSAGFIALWCGAVLLALRAMWQGTRRLAPIETARLLLLLSAAITFFLFVTSNAAALYPVSSSRYLLGFLVITPALLWPLWRAFTSEESGLLMLGPLGAKVSLTVFLLVLTTFFVSTVTTFLGIPTAEAAVSSQRTLTQQLLRIGATRIYTDYWTCNRIIFESRERILCATLNPKLGQGYDRYKPYRYAIRAQPHPSYLFPQDSPLLQIFLQKHQNDNNYQRFVFDNYILYQYKT